MNRTDRLTVALVGIIYGLMATQLRPPYYLADIIASAPQMWEWVFALTAAACVLLAVTQAVWLRWIAGALVMVAAGSRGVAVLIVAYVDPAVSLVPALGWTLVLVLQIVAWPMLAPRPNGR